MPNRLADAVSPYLRSHSENPVDWREWGPDAFAEAQERDVPVFVSIGYATCHWCHVMARESFSDPAIAEVLNRDFVAIKVDREEYPDVDAGYLAAASAFTRQLGWPLSVFTTPTGRAFYAGTYFPPTPIGEVPSFRMALGAVTEAWTERREDAVASADSIIAALEGAGSRTRGELPTMSQLIGVSRHVAALEDAEHGGFGEAPKFPAAPLLDLLLDLDRPLAVRTLDAIAASPLRDPVEGGFFRYATKVDWSEPHYERMLYDNAQLLGAYARAGRVDIATGIADFLLDVLRLPGGGFASAQDSESTVDGVPTEGGYYRLSAARRAEQVAPALDEKVLTGWNGLAIGGLALAGRLLGRADWIAAASTTAELLLERGMVRASVGDRLSTAPATIEDHGMLADGLVELAIATGDARWAIAAREIAEAASQVAPEATLQAAGIVIDTDPQEGAYPSGLAALARARHRLYLLSGDIELYDAAAIAMETVAPLAAQQPSAFAASLRVMTGIAADVTQLVVVADDTGLPAAAFARTWEAPGALSIVVTADQVEAWVAGGFELFEGRGTAAGAATAYLCRDFVCELPTSDATALAASLG